MSERVDVLLREDGEAGRDGYDDDCGGHEAETFAPAILPVVSEAVVQWSLERAMVREARGNVRAAISDMGRAIRWAGDDAGDRLAVV